MKYVTSFKLFNKILRKYYKRHNTKRIDYINGRRFVSYWETNDWLGYHITDIKQLTEGVIAHIRMLDDSKFMDTFIPELKKYLTDKSYTYALDGVTYFIDGILLTNRDYYLLLKLNNNYYIVRVMRDYKDYVKYGKL